MLFDKDYIKFENSFVSLLSTGLDSPIATYLIMKQGYDCFSLSFLNGLEKSIKNKNKIIQVGQKLVNLTNRHLRMHFVEYDNFLETIKEKCDTKLTCIVCKRTMILTAKFLAEFYKSPFIINGDILGEQASQTLDNLYVIHQINKNIPVIRPLIGFDKLDVIKISQNIGLYEKSLIEGVSCEYNPKYPETRANIKSVDETEIKLNRDVFQNEIYNSITYIDIKPN